jgi:uncharacterized membrane protein YgdD (TMEM256/DUF423 family)
MDPERRTFDPWLSAAAVNGLMAVAAGAFAAHVLRHGADPQAREWVETAATYQMWHALALLGMRAISGARPIGPWLRAGAWLFVAGIVLFCGSLYGLALIHLRPLAWITPFGGASFLLGWLALTVHGLLQRH